MPTSATTPPAGQPVQPDQPAPGTEAEADTGTDKPDADKAEPDPHERPPVRTDDN